MIRRLQITLTGFFLVTGCSIPLSAVAADFDSVGLYQSVDEMIAWAGGLRGRQFGYRSARRVRTLL